MTDESALADLQFEGEKRSRHAMACHASDVQELRTNLAAAAERFSDLADLLEKDGHTAHVRFCRASAERYRRVATKL